MDDSTPHFRAEKYLWLKHKIPLDLMDLDEQVIQLPILIQDAGECVSIANEIRDSSKDELQRVVANISHQLREEKLPSGKLRSEAMIESQVPNYPLFKDAQDALSQARLDAALWSTISDALRTKSMNIRVIVDLLNSGYLTRDYILQRRRKEIRDVQVTTK